MRHLFAGALIALGTQAGAATYTYDEATDGDLSADFSTVFTLALGDTLNVSGNRDGDDYDTFAVVYDPTYVLYFSMLNSWITVIQPGYAQVFAQELFNRNFRVRLMSLERPPSGVPLPAGLPLALAGLAALGLLGRHRTPPSSHRL